MSDALRRALRTALQTFIGVFAVSLFGWLNAVGTWAGCEADCMFPDAGVLVKAAVAAAAAAAVGLVTWVQNGVEDHTSFPAVLKAPPSEGQNPVPDA